MTWQPIETAPRDGTPFIALNHDLEVFVARIVDDRLQRRANYMSHPERFDVRVLDDGSTEQVRDEEYARREETWMNHWSIWARGYTFDPTHWLELPAPPLFEPGAP